MVSRLQPTTIENLPCEVLSKIFIRLLAKQLAQMRCISKSWNDLISDSSFIKSHLHYSIQNRDGGILLCFQEPEYQFLFYDNSITARPTHSPELELTNFIQLPINPQYKERYGSIIGSVDGLICFCYESSNADCALHIWNPSLSTVLTLPPCPLPSRDSELINFQFGFDPKTDDYKVVKLTRLSEPFNMLPQVAVYSMRNGSWNSITKRMETFPSHVRRISAQHVVCTDGRNGRLHWIGYTDDEWKARMIVGFDLGAETFSQIPLPHSILHHHEYCVLGVLGDKLCVMSRLGDGECEVWVMDEYEVPESWVKHNFSEHLSGIEAPCGFTLHHEFLFEVDFNCFGLYDTVTTKIKNFKFKNRLDGMTKIVDYVDSLVWVAPAKGEMNCCNISRYKF